MEVLIGLVAVGFVAAVPVAFILALIAASRARRLEQTVQQLQRDVAALRSRARFESTGPLEPAAAPLPAAEPAPVVVAPAAIVRPAAPPPPVSEPPAPAPQAEPSAEAPVPPTAPAPEAPAAPAPDFATNLGPRILVAMGALAVVTFLGLFVRYAWENNWVGPVGRIILGTAGSLSLLGIGLRLLDREMRPLGQGLAAIGLAGLYVCAFAAHSFYALVPNAVAGFLMLAVTVSGVLLADRLDARLLAGLAWMGGYLTPILLSTGEDKAWTLYGYLLLLAAGALVLDHRKPWGETMPLALFGTMVLYGGWYAEHFRPERFEVAAFGLVLFTGVFAFGMANKERGPWLVVVALLAGLGLAVLAGGADRPALLIPMSLLIAGLALRGSLQFGAFLALPAAVIAGLPFVVWAASHYHPVHFGAAAAWIVGAGLLFVFGLQGGATDKPRDLGHLLAVGLVVGGGFASIALAAQTDRPGPLLALLAAQAAMAALLRARGWSVEAVQAALAAVSVVAWYERFFEPGREPAVWLLTFGVAVIYLGLFLGKGLAGTAALGFGGVVGHLIVATFVWSMLFRVLYDTRSAQLALISVALAAFYLAAGLLAKQRRPQDALQVRVLLGLAAGFVTLAIPVRMGLHGITIAWAVEGLLLLSLGRRFDSRLARLGGDLVLMLAVVRLFVRHAPLHAGPFTPFANPAFGTWLFVIAAVGLAAVLGRYFGEGADRNLSRVLCVLTLALLFGVLTHETQEAFDQRARVLLDLRDTDGATAAQREGGVAISVLWTSFATALLAGGLLLRNRPLFYGGYALFAVTAAKVTFIDLATFPPLYRMLSILALGVLLLAGAWLNLRFRERLI